MSRKTWPGAVALLLVLLSTVASAAPDGPPSRGNHPPDGAAARPHQWFDGSHGHARYYPTPGWAVRTLPPRSNVVFWAGANYHFHDGVWYSPGSRGWVVVRPPFGIVVNDLPLFRTALVVGGLTYLYANGAYYRERVEGGYEVVPTPIGPGAPAPTGPAKSFVYPSRGQTPERQATDEYECHRWATTQAGFDPTLAATGQQTPAADGSRRDDYHRARTACLEGRGYTVR